jgi:hypothetical protein
VYAPRISSANHTLAFAGEAQNSRGLRFRRREPLSSEAKSGWKGHQWRKEETAAWEACHKNQAQEWDVLTFARTLDETAALKSASYGAGQIMGFNHKTVGYADVQTMVKKFDEGIKPQLDAILAFIKANKLCMQGLKADDYVMFARGYNGARQATRRATMLSRRILLVSFLHAASGSSLVAALISEKWSPLFSDEGPLRRIDY